MLGVAVPHCQPAVPEETVRQIRTVNANIFADLFTPAEHAVAELLGWNYTLFGKIFRNMAA